MTSELDTMRDIRRKEKAIIDKAEMETILLQTKYVTIAMCDGAEPYLVTLSHGYDSENSCLYFHCAQEGKKIDILQKNDRIWGQALADYGYVQGSCDHLYATVQFNGTVSFITDLEEKRLALLTMIRQLEDDPETVSKEQITEKSLKRVGIGKISLQEMSGKKSKEVIISL